MATARRKIAAISEMPKSAAKNSLQNQAIMFIGSFGDCHSSAQPASRYSGIVRHAERLDQQGTYPGKTRNQASDFSHKGTKEFRNCKFEVRISS
jgi:hypothetical protein